MLHKAHWNTNTKNGYVRIQKVIRLLSKHSSVEPREKRDESQ